MAGVTTLDLANQVRAGTKDKKLDMLLIACFLNGVIKSDKNGWQAYEGEPSHLADQMDTLYEVLLRRMQPGYESLRRFF